ncbi:hypothetical protein ACFU9K_42665, partial [Streptomyces sp. NPDC057582]
MGIQIDVMVGYPINDEVERVLGLAEAVGEPCACRIPHLRWSGRMLVLVEGAAESRASAYVETRDSARIFD